MRTPRDQIDRLLSFAKRALRYAGVAGVIFGVGAVLSLVVALKFPRKYQSETVLLFREGIHSSYLGNQESGANRDLGNRLRELLLSRPRLEKMVDEFHLFPELVQRSGHVEAVNSMRQKITFRTRGDIYHIAFIGSRPDQAQKVTARLADSLVEESTRLRLENINVTKSFLDEEKKRNEGLLKEKERELAEFLAKHPEFAQELTMAGPSGTTGASIRAATQGRPQGSEPQDSALRALERQRERIRGRLTTSSTPAPAPVPRESSQVDPKLVAEKNAAEAEVSAAERDLADKLGRFTEQHPDVRAAQRRKSSAQARLDRANAALAAGSSPVASAEVVPATEGEKAALRTQLERIEQEISSYRRRRAAGSDTPSAGPAPAPPLDRAGEIVALETDWARIMREVREARDRQEQLETSQFKAAIAAASATSGFSAQLIVIDPAYKPTKPAPPGRTLILGLGLFVFAALGTGVVLLLALLDDRIYEGADLERLEIAPVLMVMPRTRSRRLWPLWRKQNG
ncbi:MAG: protein kinase [Deltaproteobacteria bacterium]|nr:protein kinase [Deltaproteobacteria bacterium]